MRARSLTLAALLAACGTPHAVPDAPPPLPSCWSLDCPTDPGASSCGTCKDPGVDHECPPGFICAHARICVKGPFPYDAGPTDAHVGPDAGPIDADLSPDARRYDWSVCLDDASP